MPVELAPPLAGPPVETDPTPWRARAIGRTLVTRVPTLPLTRAHVRRWSAQGFWAVLDQAIFAGANLVMNVLLARWMAPAEYGAFVTAYTLLLLVGVAHTALLSEPMLVFGADRYGAAFSDYLRVLHRYHWTMMLAAAAALGISAGALNVLGYGLLARSVAGLAVASPCILLGWLGRRACYPVSQPRRAATAGVVNLVLLVGAIALLGRTGALGVFTAQVALAASSLGAAACMLPPLFHMTPERMTPEVRAAVWRHHWNYGRWSGATGALNWIQSYVYFLVLPIWSGLAATGALKALLNLVMPVLQSDAALVTVLTPQLVRGRRTPNRFRTMVWWGAAAFALESTVYWVAVLLWAPPLLTWLYAGAYTYPPRILLWLGLVPLFSAQLNLLGSALRAREQPDAVFWAVLASVVVACTAGLGAVALRGVEGAVIGLAIGAATQVLIMGWLLTRKGAHA